MLCNHHKWSTSSIRRTGCYILEVKQIGPSLSENIDKIEKFQLSGSLDGITNPYEKLDGYCFKYYYDINGYCMVEYLPFTCSWESKIDVNKNVKNVSKRTILGILRYMNIPRKH